jgi:hypothetical protein
LSQSGALRERLQKLRAFLARAVQLIIGDVTWTRPAWIESLRARPWSFTLRAVDDQGQADARLVELAVVP